MLVQERSTFDEMLAAVAESNYVVLDTETNKTKTLVDRYIIGFSVGVPVDAREVRTWYIPIRHDTLGFKLEAENVDKYWIKELNSTLKGKTIIMHNIKFDVEMFEKEGLDFEDVKLVCTAIWSVLHCEEKPRPLSHKLESLEMEFFEHGEKHHLRQPLKKLEKVMEWHQIPPEAMAPYAENDVVTPWWLYQKFLPSLEEQELMDYYWTKEVPFMHVLKQIEQRGVHLDLERTKEFAQRTVERMIEVRRELGFDPDSRIQLAHKLYAEPPIGLGLPVRSRGATTKSFPQGQPTMDKEVLSTYSHPIVGLVLEYRGLAKQHSTYLLPWQEFARIDGKLHPNFKQIGTETGRLSCEHPNLQQIPRDSYLKTLFHASEGFVLVEFDYSQMEFRLAAKYAGEQEILRQLNEGADFHQITADLMGVKRFTAKNANFAFCYGAGPVKFATTLGVDFKKGKELYDHYRSTFPGLATTLGKAERAASNRGWVKNWCGRRRHFLYPSQSYAAFNSIIQGGAFEIVKESMLRMAGAGYRMVNQVHDSVWIELPEASWQVEAQRIRKIMEEWVEELFEIPFPVDVKELKRAS